MNKISKIFVASLLTACAQGNQSKDEVQYNQNSGLRGDGSSNSETTRLAEFDSCKELFNSFWQAQMIRYADQVWDEVMNERAAGGSAIGNASNMLVSADQSSCDLDAKKQVRLRNALKGQLDLEKGGKKTIFSKKVLNQNDPLPLLQFKSTLNGNHAPLNEEFKKFKNPDCFRSAMEKRLSKNDFLAKKDLSSRCLERVEDTKATSAGGKPFFRDVYEDDIKVENPRTGRPPR